MQFTQDRLAGLIFLLFGVAALVIGRGYKMGAEIFPMAAAGLMVVCALLLLARPPGPRIRQPGEEELDGEEPPAGSATGRRIAAAIILTALYIGAVGVVGYVTASAVFILAAALGLGMRQWRLVAVVGALFLGGLYALFHYGFQTPLPPEIWQRLS